MQKGKIHIFARILITLVGAFFILFAINEVGLSLFGETAKATNVYTSRIGSRDSEQPADKEYRWSVSWTFEVDGKEYGGRANTRGSAIGVKHGETVYYYSFLPQINSIYAKDSAGIWTLAQIGVGSVLIIAVNAKQKKRGRYANKTVKNAQNEIDDYDDSVEEVFHND